MNGNDNRDKDNRDNHDGLCAGDVATILFTARYTRVVIFDGYRKGRCMTDSGYILKTEEDLYY